MTTKNPESGSTEPDDQADEDEEATSPDTLPSGAGPQAEGDQSDISPGGGADS